MATKLKDIGTVQDALNELDANSTLHGAMALAFAEIEAATKSAPNEAFKRNGKASKYADLPAVIEAVKPALVKHSLWVSQHCQPSDGGVTVETVLHHSGGESLSMGSLFVPANKHDAHGFGSALTYARRYAFQTAFVVPTEDDDGNAAVAAMHADPIEPPSAPRGDGDMSDSALRGCIKTLIHNINGCGTVRDLDDLLDNKDAQETVEQCQRRFPHWWETGVGLPREFVPLKKIIADTRRELAKLETA